MGFLSYLGALISPKKFINRHIAFTAMWDNTSKFTDQTHLLSGSHLNHSSVGRYSRVGKNSKLTYVTVGNYTAIKNNADKREYI